MMVQYPTLLQNTLCSLPPHSTELETCLGIMDDEVQETNHVWLLIQSNNWDIFSN